jgi:hypothetical protein
MIILTFIIWIIVSLLIAILCTYWILNTKYDSLFFPAALLIWSLLVTIGYMYVSEKLDEQEPTPKTTLII